MKNIQKSTIIFSVAIVILAVFSVWQQIEINQIKNGQVEGAVSGANGVAPDTAQKQQPFNQLEAVKNDLLKSKTVSGIIVSSKSSEIVIKANLVNLSALDKFDFKASQSLPAVEKNLTIRITKDTVKFGKAVADEVATIQTKEPIYGGGTLTAVSVSVFVPPTTSGAPKPL